HAGQDVLLHALGDLVGDLLVRHVPPPGEHVGAGQRLLAEAVLGVVEQGDAGADALAEMLDAAVADRGVHALGVVLAHALVALLVPALAPDGDPQGWGGRAHAVLPLAEARASRTVYGDFVQPSPPGTG